MEWLDPVFVAGHWTPQLIELAGGEDVMGFAGEPSQEFEWETLAAAQPEVVVVMPCGYDAPRPTRRRSPSPSRSRAAARRVAAVDAAAYFSRPGPRLIDGVELLAHILHPQQVALAPQGAQALEVELAPEAEADQGSEPSGERPAPRPSGACSSGPRRSSPRRPPRRSPHS